jgi:hypothetical protein
MKSYIQGLITGSVLVFGFMVLTASNSDAYYDTDDLMTKLNEIEYKLDDIESDVRGIKRNGVDCN